jgi:hypothetical protein
MGANDSVGSEGWQGSKLQTLAGLPHLLEVLRFNGAVPA